VSVEFPPLDARSRRETEMAIRRTPGLRRARPHLAVLTSVTMVCFAGNSLLSRLALRGGGIDAASFTAVRLGAAAVVLSVLARLAGAARAPAGSWTSAAVLFGYAIAFSLAYVQIDAGVGALLLFGAVQVTMVGWGIIRGERPGAAEWAGLLVALLGLVLLSHPGTSASPLGGVPLMFLAGVGWGIFSLRGRRSDDSLQATAAIFARTLPFVAAMVAVAFVVNHPHLSLPGVVAGVVSGGVTSGLGYVLWYRALSRLTALQAASVQLTVPVLAALGGVVFLGERPTLRLLGGAALVLGGIALSIVAHVRSTAR